jgi:hypothetical protein
MLPKDFLTFWAAKEAAEAAVNNWDIVSQLCKRDPKGAVDYLKNAHRRKSGAAADLGSAAHDLLRAPGARGDVNDRHVHIDVKPHVRWFSGVPRRGAAGVPLPRRDGVVRHPTATPAASTPSRRWTGRRSSSTGRPRRRSTTPWRSSSPPTATRTASSWRSPGVASDVPEMVGGAVLHVRAGGLAARYQDGVKLEDKVRAVDRLARFLMGESE